MPRRSTALLATVGIAAAVMALPTLFRRHKRETVDEQEQYRQYKTPEWAPPGWAFPVAWTASTLALAASAQHIAFRQNHPRREELLVYLGLHTALYATFSRVYFDERSPVLAAAWTVGDFAICHLAFYRAWGVSDRVAAGFLPVNLWLTLAAPLSLYQAAANHDGIFGAKGIEAGEIVAAAIGRSPIGGGG